MSRSPDTTQQAVEDILKAIERSKTPEDVKRHQEKLDKMLQNLSEAKKQVGKRAAKKIEQIENPPSEVERHLEVLAKMHGMWNYYLRHVKRDLQTLIARHDDPAKAKRLVTQVKRNTAAAVEKEYMRTNVDPLLNGVDIANADALTRDALSAVRFISGERSTVTSDQRFRPLPKKTKKPKKPSNAPKAPAAPKPRVPCTSKKNIQKKRPRSKPTLLPAISSPPSAVNSPAPRAQENSQEKAPKPPAKKPKTEQAERPMVDLVSPRIYTCVICLQKCDGNEKLTAACTNGHEYCLECIKAWAAAGKSGSGSCPMCKEDMSRVLEGL